MYAFAFIITVVWILVPNITLAAATLNKASEDTHLALGALAFVPWTLLGLSLV